MPVREGTVEYLGYRTWYRIVGDCQGEKKPLLLLHGGPGSTHNYFEVLDPLAEEDGRALIMYDQLGCGKSPAPGRKDLMNLQVWVGELENLRACLGLEECHILGHSWGGMLLLEYVCGQPRSGVSSLILASTLPSSSLYGSEQRRMLRELPQDMQDAIAEAERTGDYDSEAYQRANAEFMSRHCGPTITEDSPDCLRRHKHAGRDAYLTAWGPNEYTPVGNLKDFDRTGDLGKIRIPTLITSGAEDMCTPLIAETMHSGIPGSERVLFEHSRHYSFIEENRRYLDVLKDWLNRHD